MTTADPVLQVRDLTVLLGPPGRAATVLDGVNLDVPRQGTLALVGESGCGKTMTALAILGLLPPGAVAEGSIVFRPRGGPGQELRALEASVLRRLRGRRLGIVFQEPMTSLNPTLRAGEQVAEGLRYHLGRTRSEARAEAEALLRRVGFERPEAVARAFPHELSGGMRQRVLVAMAAGLKPDLLIADEPTTALDVLAQREMLEVLRRLQAEDGMSLLLISHDLAVVGRTADAVAVMYAGRVVETAPAAAFLETARHPYATALLRSRPELRRKRRRLEVIPGAVPAPGSRPPGCAFAPRCPAAVAECREQTPVLQAVDSTHLVACPPALRRRPESEGRGGRR